MIFNPGFEIEPTSSPLGFRFGTGVYAPNVEYRKLDSIRRSLMDSQCSGPEDVYAIAMDTGLAKDRQKMLARNLLFGVVTYATGTLGAEPIRSQGHIHAVSPSCNSSTCELYEIWEGKACIYMQETAKDYPGRCYAVYANPGDVVLVPPGWAHMTISADSRKSMTFGAWCVRDYGFEYADVRAHGGLAWFPVYEGNKLVFLPNKAYHPSELIEKKPEKYRDLGLVENEPVYIQFQKKPDRFLFVSRPDTARDAEGRSLWDHFIP